MDESADDLGFDDHGVDYAAGVVDHRIAENTNGKNNNVDLDFHPLTTHAVNDRAWNGILHALESRLEISRHRIARYARHRLRNGFERHARTRHAGHVDAAILQFQIVRACLEQMRRYFQYLFAYGNGGHMHRRTGGDGLTAGKS